MRRLLGATAVVVCLALSPASAHAEASGGGGFVEYRVREGDTCESIAASVYGSAGRGYVIHDYNPHARRARGECDEDLRPGTTLRLPRQAPESGTPDAEVTAVLRRVRSKSPDLSGWAMAHAGQDLWRGWRVNTLEQAAADLTFRDTSRMHLREDTLVIIYGPVSRRARRQTSKAVLKRGALRSHLAALAGLSVETPAATATLGRGQALVTVDEEEVSRVANHEGIAAEVTSTKGRVRVKAGMGSKVRRGGRPTPPRPLPPTPGWTTGDPEVFVALPGRGATVSGSWEAVEKAAHYRIEIAHEPDGFGPVGSTGVPAAVTRFELHGLPSGTYYLSVASIDDDRFESRPSKQRTVRVVDARLHRPGGAPPEETPADEPAARRGAQPARVLPGTRLVLPDGVRCGIGDQEPSAEVVLVGEGPLEVACVAEGSAHVATLSVDVVAVRATARAAEGAGSATVTRGSTASLTVQLTADLPLPEELGVDGGPGLDVIDVERLGGGALRLTVAAASDAPDETRVAITAAADGQDPVGLATVELHAVDAEADASPEPSLEQPDEGRPPALHEGSSLEASGFAFGVRDELRRGNGLSLVGGYSLAPELEPEHSGRASVGLQIGLLDDRLGLAAAVPFGTAGADGGARAGASWLLLDGSPVGLSVQLSAWIPFSAPDEGGYRARLIPSADLSARVGERWALRTRQGAMLDTAAAGAFLWASAYAVDVRVAGPFALGFEGMLLLGAEDGHLVAAPTVALALALDLGLAEITLLARYGITDDAEQRLGRLAILLGARLGGTR